MTWSEPIGALELPALRAPSVAEGQVGTDGLWSPPRWASRPVAVVTAAPPDATELAFARGYEAGRREAESTAGTDLLPVLHALQLAGERMHHAEAVFERDRTQVITILALAVARHLMLEEVQSNPNRVSQLVSRAIEEVPNEGALEIHLHPHDLLAMQAAGDLPEAPVQLKWIPDPALSRGDCVVESQTRLVDGRVDVTLRRLLERLGHE
jgi:flagellar assembly protein FliH